MALLEIVAGGSDPLQAAFAVQRTRLEEETDIVSVNFMGMPMRDRLKVLKKIDASDKAPEAVLLRGIDMLPEVTAYVPKGTPIFVDHCTPSELGKTSPLRRSLRRVHRVYCYSQKSDSELRQAGFGRVTVVPGPTIPTETWTESDDRVAVAILNTCTNARHVLARIIKVGKKQGWPVSFVSSIKHSAVKQVSNDFEAAEQADLIVAPNEDKDFGQPHDGAIIAIAMGSPLVSTRSEAFNIMAFPAKNFLSAQKYQIGTYAAAVGNYLHNRRKYDEWVEGSGPDPYLLPNDLLSRMT